MNLEVIIIHMIKVPEINHDWLLYQHNIETYVLHAVYQAVQ